VAAAARGVTEDGLPTRFRSTRDVVAVSYSRVPPQARTGRTRRSVITPGGGGSLRRLSAGCGLDGVAAAGTMSSCGTRGARPTRTRICRRRGRGWVNHLGAAVLDLSRCVHLAGSRTAVWLSISTVPAVTTPVPSAWTSPAGQSPGRAGRYEREATRPGDYETSGCVARCTDADMSSRAHHRHFRECRRRSLDLDVARTRGRVLLEVSIGATK